MNFYFQFFLLFSVSFANGKKCQEDERTFSFKYSMATGQKLFLPESYLLKDDPCLPMVKEEFLALNSRNHNEQLNVDHIVDDINEKLNGYFHILGNMILANETWLFELSSFCWENVKYEKQEVYKEYFENAVYYVKHCKIDNYMLILEQDKNEKVLCVELLLFWTFLLIVLFIVVVCCCRCFCGKVEGAKDYVYSLLEQSPE